MRLARGHQSHIFFEITVDNIKGLLYNAQKRNIIMKQIVSQNAGKILYLMRGPSGTGKSTLAKEMSVKEIFSADHFFTAEDGTYNFNPSQIGRAHAICKAKTEDALKKGISPIAVDNTFTKRFEVRPYVEMAQRHGYNVEFIEPNWSEKLRNPDGAWNVDFIMEMQNSPERVKTNKSLSRNIIEKMVNRYEYDLTLDDF